MTDPISGRGPAHPFSVGPNGSVVESAGPERIEQSIRVILGTQHGERVMRPTFGCDLRSLAFAPNDAATANLARHLVEAGLTRWEPRIELVDVQVDNDPGGHRLIITVGYRIRDSEETRSTTIPVGLGGIP